MRESSTLSDSAFDAAARRLDAALKTLERAIARRAPVNDDARTVAALSQALESARARERVLEEVTAEASAALGRAAEEVRAALAAEA